jgi:hypothetical protein
MNAGDILRVIEGAVKFQMQFVFPSHSDRATTQIVFL